MTGALGNLARALIPLLKIQAAQVVETDSRNPEIPSPDFRVLDIRKHHEVRQAIERAEPDLVVHLAAATDVDQCERIPELAFQVNAFGTENVALACQRGDIPLVYLSTAEVFDGEKKTPYTEYDEPRPLNVYARSKLEGEKAVQGLLKKYFVVRTAWLAGGGRADQKFVGKIMRLLGKEKSLRVVSDKIGSPTFTGDLAKNLLALIETGRFGLYHLCNQGFCSRYEMVQAMLETLGRKDVKLIPVSSADFPLPAVRGKSEALENFKLNQMGINQMPHWKESLENYLRKEF